LPTNPKSVPGLSKEDSAR